MQTQQEHPALGRCSCRTPGCSLRAQAQGASGVDAGHIRWSFQEIDGGRISESEQVMSAMSARSVAQTLRRQALEQLVGEDTHLQWKSASGGTGREHHLCPKGERPTHKEASMMCWHAAPRHDAAGCYFGACDKTAARKACQALCWGSPLGAASACMQGWLM